MKSIEQLNWESKQFESWFAGYRLIQDEYADSVAQAIITSPDKMLVYPALASIVKNDDVVTQETFDRIKAWQVQKQSTTTTNNDKLIALLNNYFNDNSEVKQFSITNEEKKILQDAAMIFNARIVECTLILAVRSLLKQYAAYNATQVLASTKMLSDFPHRRILATMQFVLDVMAPNAFDPEGSGFRSIQKLRLVHAMIRARINDQSAEDSGNTSIKGDMQISTKFWGGKEWNEMEFGKPINQQDMIFAVHTFSVEVIEGLIESGEDVDSREIETYYMAWHIIGRMLGVKPEINPFKYSEGKALQQKIYDVQFNPVNKNGQPISNPIAPALALPLIEFIKEFARLPKVSYVYAIIKRFNNDVDEKFFENKLAIPLSNLSRRFEWLVIIADKLQDFAFDFWSLIRYFKIRDKNIKLAGRMHNMMQAIVDSQSTWGTKHFRPNDGFGMQAGKEDEAKMKAGRPSLFKIAIKAFITDKDIY